MLHDTLRCHRILGRPIARPHQGSAGDSTAFFCCQRLPAFWQPLDTFGLLPRHPTIPLGLEPRDLKAGIVTIRPAGSSSAVEACTCTDTPTPTASRRRARRTVWRCGPQWARASLARMPRLRWVSRVRPLPKCVAAQVARSLTCTACARVRVSHTFAELGHSHTGAGQHIPAACCKEGCVISEEGSGRPIHQRRMCTLARAVGARFAAARGGPSRSSIGHDVGRARSKTSVFCRVEPPNCRHFLVRCAPLKFWRPRTYSTSRVRKHALFDAFGHSRRPLGRQVRERER